MRPLVLALALLLPSLASAQTIMRGEGVISGEVHADVYNGAVLVIDPEDTTLNTLTTSAGDVTQIVDNVSGLTFTSLVGNDPEESSVTTGDGRTVAALLFDDANTEELSTASSVADTGGYAGVVVFAPDDVSINQAPLCIGDTGTSTDYSMVYVTSGAVYQAYTSDAGSGASAAVLQSVSTEPTTFRIRETFTGGRYGGSDGFTESGTAASRSPSSLDVTAIGKRIRNSSDFYVSGKILAVYLFSSDTSDDYLRAVENYLHKAKIHDPGAGIPGPGLVLDLDATDSGSLTITSSPDVDAWANVANKGITSVTQGTAGNKPHTGGSINSLNAITFDDAASQYLNSTGWVDSAAATVFAVVTLDDQTDNCTIVGWNDSGNSNHFAIIDQATTNARWAIQAGGTIAQAITSGVTSGTSYVLSATEEASGADRDFYLQPGGLSDNDTNSRSIAADTINVGRLDRVAAVGNYLDGSIGRILRYKRVLSDEERQSAEGALATTWGVTLN